VRESALALINLFSSKRRDQSLSHDTEGDWELREE